MGKLKEIRGGGELSQQGGSERFPKLGDVWVGC